MFSAAQRYTKEGWPHALEREDLKHYKRLESSLSSEHGCLLLRSRIVIPTKLQDAVLKLIHLVHLNMQQMKQLARSAVYWPHIDEDIETLSHVRHVKLIRTRLPNHLPTHGCYRKNHGAGYMLTTPSTSCEPIGLS